jgi:hypothetical protein
MCVAFIGWRRLYAFRRTLSLNSLACYRTSTSRVGGVLAAGDDQYGHRRRVRVLGCPVS